ncbi:MAG: NAD(P)H-dependent oxidoreductase subunit E [Ruminococcaceae bacterium]|nr:NAD(P)H-dependent oxidoreductase subunit E [Oscillospiraceae bacterium]
MNNDCNCCCDERFSKLDAVIEKNKSVQGSLIQTMHEAQEIFGYLPIEVQKFISEKTGVPLAEIYGVATFYTQFSLKPKGEYKISVCLGTACYVKGADLLLDELKKALDIDVGDCTEDGRFSLEACRCIGACGLAPVFTVNDDVYGRLVPEDVPGIVAKYR